MNATPTIETTAVIELDAREFGMHVSQGGWRLGLLVARCVEPGEGDGVNLSRSVRSGLEDGEKVSATRFAEISATYHSRVMRYYRAWERAADKGHVPYAAVLHPGEDIDLDWQRLPEWRTVFADPSALTGGATGTLNLTIKLGQYGDRLRRSHKRLLYFIERELPEQTAGKQVRALAGRYADALEAEAKVLRQVEAGDRIDPDEVKQDLAPERFFIQ